ncbi:hypothetical protein SCHPADRAFT_1002069 [Schizopora paradoxa]|uniref:MYND-type domain-containing protein n=1 Tax=Schizopora paradoxa TaxID=27342 RepID=A0A0H2RPV7_9AGAM|nr:hypothetical protein SCHPADRAFT_1002069 [Schizopora paradoxa]
MYSARGSRRSFGRRESSPAISMKSSSGGRVFITAHKVAKMIETAREDMTCLTAINESILSFPVHLQLKAFEVFAYHLQKPVEQHLCEAEEPYHWIMKSLLGIRQLGYAFFERDAERGRRFAKCWPHIVKWLKALLDLRPDYDEQNKYALATSEAFCICQSVIPDALKEDEAVELAVRAWMGFEDPDGRDRYTAGALLSCLSVNSNDTARPIQEALRGCDVSIEDVVEKLVTRIDQATSKSSSDAIATIATLSNVAVLLLLQRGLALELSFAIKIKLAHYIASILDVILRDTNRKGDRLRTVRYSLVIMECLLAENTIAYGITLVRNGILRHLLDLASSDCESNDCMSMASDVLQHLLQCVVYEDMLLPCKEELRKLHEDEQQLKSKLKASPKGFRETWKALEAMLLESTILCLLFAFGYAPEYGVCASRTCRNLALRESFSKCAGCAFALYCSPSCQKEDWKSHKVSCKKMDPYCRNVVQDKYRRFPRRIALLHIQRRWDQIVSIARRKNIRLCDMAVRVSFNVFPFKIEVLDYHDFLDGTKGKSHLALAANEMQRQPDEDRRKLLMVIIRMPQIEFPCIVHLDGNTWTREVSHPPGDSRLDERTLFVDQDGNGLPCTHFDALRMGVHVAKKHAAELGESVWEKAGIRKATDDMIAEFEKEICDSVNLES